MNTRPTTAFLSPCLQDGDKTIGGGPAARSSAPRQLRQPLRKPTSALLTKPHSAPGPRSLVLWGGFVLSLVLSQPAYTADLPAPMPVLAALPAPPPPVAVADLAKPTAALPAALARAQEAMLRADWPAALQALEGREADPQCRFWLGYCHYQSGVYPAAKQMLLPFAEAVATPYPEGAAVAAPWADHGLLYLARAQVLLGETDAALESLRSLAERFPRSPLHAIAQVTLLDLLFYDRRDYPSALEVARKLMEELGQRPEAARVLYQALYCLQRTNQSNTAAPLWAKLADFEDAGSEARRWILQAQQKLLMGDPAAADQLVTFLHEQLPEDPSWPDAAVEAVTMLVENRQIPAAMRLISLALKRLDGTNRPQVEHLLDLVPLAARDPADLARVLSTLQRDYNRPALLRVLARRKLAEQVVGWISQNTGPMTLEKLVTEIEEGAAKETSEFAIVETALLLAEIQEGCFYDNAAAARLLRDAQKRITARMDLNRVLARRAAKLEPGTPGAVPTPQVSHP